MDGKLRQIDLYPRLILSPVYSLEELLEMSENSLQ